VQRLWRWWWWKADFAGAMGFGGGRRETTGKTLVPFLCMHVEAGKPVAFFNFMGVRIFVT